MKLRHVIGIAAGLTLSGAIAQADEAACAAIEDMKFEVTNLLSATIVEATDALPAYCRVLGYVRPAINFEVRMPVEDWNGKFYMAGCGGFCGALNSDAAGFVNAMNYGLARGYAAATMDGGNWGASTLDGRWGKDNPVGEDDWGWRAVQETTRVAKGVIEAYYTGGPERSYFAGCSTGGRMANMVALRQPGDFDGIISGAPALDYTGLVATAFAWIVQANTAEEGSRILTPEDAPVVRDAVVAACDGLDGVEDGMVSNPNQCRFDPATLDLAPEKIAVLQAWYDSARNSAGEELYPGGVPVGSEAFWGLWLTGFEGGGGGLVPGFGINFLRYMAFAEDPDAGYTAMDFDFDTDPARLADRAAVYNSDNPDISAFRDAGGKLLMWHGWADAIVFPGKTVDYYEALAAENGGVETTQDFARLFMIPGMDHCGILGSGPGIDQAGFDPLSALETWVEDGAAPESLMTTKTVESEAQWTRPVCAYPAEATFSGEGDWRDATAWTCETN